MAGHAAEWPECLNSGTTTKSLPYSRMRYGIYKCMLVGFPKGCLCFQKEFAGMESACTGNTYTARVHVFSNNRPTSYVHMISAPEKTLRGEQYSLCFGPICCHSQSFNQTSSGCHFTFRAYHGHNISHEALSNAFEGPKGMENTDAHLC